MDGSWSCLCNFLRKGWNYYHLFESYIKYLPVSQIWIWYLLCWFWFHCFYLGFQKLLSKLFSKGSDIRHCWVSCLMKLVCSFILHFFNTFIQHLMKIKIILLKVKITRCLPRIRFNMKKYLCTCKYIYIYIYIYIYSNKWE